MDKEALAFNKQGLQLIHSGRLPEAIEFFTKAIELEPDYPDPYHHRGEALILLDRFVEGNTDIQRAKNLRAGKQRIKQKHQEKVKLNLQEIDSIYDTVFPDGSEEKENSTLEFDDTFYDFVFSDDPIEQEETWDQIASPRQEPESFQAIIEFRGGRRQEAPAVIPFQPTSKDISLLREDGHVERVIAMDNICCIRLTGLPADYSKQRTDSCHVEIIETLDGNIYHEAIHPDQDIDNVLLGFSTKEQTRFTYSLIPKGNIKQRCQQRYLGEILIEKRFIANDILKNALEEYQQVKNMKIGRIIAQKAQILYSAIEEELAKAREGNIHGLKTGEILLASGLVSEDQVLEALEYQERMQKMKIGEFLIDKGIVQEKEIYIALAEKFRIPFVDLRKQKVSKKVLTLLPKDFVLANEILPISHVKGKLRIAILRPEVNTICAAIPDLTECEEVECVLVQPTHLRNIINLLYKKIGLGD